MALCNFIDFKYIPRIRITFRTVPQIVIDQKVDFDFSKKSQTILLKKKFLVKTLTIFVDSNNLKTFLPTFVISKLHQKYFTEISTKVKTTIKLLSMTDPKKTIEIKESVVLVGKLTLQNYSNLKIIQTNNPQANV